MSKSKLDPSRTPLAQSSLDVVITDLLAEYELRHTFRNTDDQAIEAVYSFPIPLDAAFVSMQATLAGETLTAQVLPAQQANRQYDDAISDGDTAVLLEQLEPGLLCVNLGNLLPGEAGEIVLRFVAALGTAEGKARFSLPLAYRPRYGRSRLDQLVTPTHDFAVEHPLQACIRIRGLLAGCPVQCASAGARFTQAPGETTLHLTGAMLDRDLVLGFELGHNPPPQASLIQDGKDSIALLAFNVPLPQAPANAARDICLLLDGSGSMAGDAIVQSRQALLAVADALQADDRIQLIRFGSTSHALFRRPLRATPKVRSALRELAPTVQADLGGTEMNDALSKALAALGTLDGPAHHKAVILVTDGAVQRHEVQPALERARREGIRVFVVAVGSSASVDVLEPLAQQTGATLERTMPAEPIDAGVLRQLRRTRTAPVPVTIDWGSERARPLPLHPLYPGDAVTALTRCTGQAPRSIRVSAALAQPGTMLQCVLDTGMAQAHPALRAWAGHQVHAHAAPAEQEAMALRYGLITPHTKAVLVKVRADGHQAVGLPVVKPVAHMHPAGMGLGLQSSYVDLAVPSVWRCNRTQTIAKVGALSSGGMDDFEIPAFLRKSDIQAEPIFARQPVTPDLRSVQRCWDDPAPYAGEWDHAVIHPALTPALKDALADVLAELLQTGQRRLLLQQILERIAPAHWDDIARFLADYMAQRRNKDPAGLLQHLLDAGAQLLLDDEQEANLSVLLNSKCVN